MTGQDIKDILSQETIFKGLFIGFSKENDCYEYNIGSNNIFVEIKLAEKSSDESFRDYFSRKVLQSSNFSLTDDKDLSVFIYESDDINNPKINYCK